MELANRVIVVTGAGSGIGAAMSRRFAREGPRALVVADIDLDSASAVASSIDAMPIQVDVSAWDANDRLIGETEDRFGPIDLFCSNAGVALPGGADAPDDFWKLSIDVNLMAHVYAARAVLPGMIARGEGYLLHTASAAGLLTNIGAAPYSVTKHAAVGLAEWLAITHGDQGIKVSCLCPQGVRTNMLMAGAGDAAGAVVLSQGAIEPDDVAEAVVQGLRAESFLILPHPEVLTHFQRKAGDYDRWLGGMRKLQRRISDALS